MSQGLAEGICCCDVGLPSVIARDKLYRCPSFKPVSNRSTSGASASVAAAVAEDAGAVAGAAAAVARPRARRAARRTAAVAAAMVPMWRWWKVEAAQYVHFHCHSSALSMVDTVVKQGQNRVNRAKKKTGAKHTKVVYRSDEHILYDLFNTIYAMQRLGEVYGDARC